MGTEVQGKMYLPGCYSMRDLNDATSNGNWPSHHEKKTFVQYYDIPTTDGYVGYEKEQLRQTILRHETIFRHQLHELHRLHKIQKEMMTDVRSKELHQQLNPIPVGTSQSSYFAFPSGDGRKKWHDSDLPSVDFNHRIPSSSAADSIQSNLSSMNVEIMQSGCCSTHNGSRFKDHESLESRYKKLERRLFDLELPAKKYMNDEDEGQGASGGSGVDNYPSNRNYNVKCEKNGNVTTQNGAYSGCNGDALSSSMFLRTRGFTDVNEVVQVEEASGTASVDILGNITRSKEGIQRWDLSANSCSGFPCLAKEISQNLYKGKDEGTSACSRHLDDEKKQKGWLPCPVSPGQTMSNRSSHNGALPSEYFPAPCESSQVGCRKAHASDQNKTEKGRKKTIFGVETFEKNNNTSGMASDKLVLKPQVTQSTVANSESSSISAWKKLQASSRQDPTFLQGNSCFNTFSDSRKCLDTLIHGPKVTRDMSLHNCNLRSIPSLGAEQSYQNGLYFGSQLNSKELQACHPLVGVGYLNGNHGRNSTSEQVPQYGATTNFRGSSWLGNTKSAEEVKMKIESPKGYWNKAVSDLNLISIDDPREEESLQGGLFWLRNISPCNGKSSKERGGSHQVKLDSLQRYSQQFVSKDEKMKCPSQSFIQDSSSVTNDQDTEDRRIESGDCSSNRKILGVSFSEKQMSKDLPSASSALKPSFASEINGTNFMKVGLLNTDLNLDPMPSESEEIENTESLVEEKESVRCSSNLRRYIDLNVSVTEEEAQLAHFSPRTKVKIAVEIDLEAPVVVETEISITSRGEFVESKLEGPFDSFKDKSTDLHDDSVMAAAEALVAISSSGLYNPQDNANCHQLETSPIDSLKWFAEIISSFGGDTENGVGFVGQNNTYCEDSIPNGLGYFEYMTLNLTEAKVEECSYKPMVVENDEITLPRRPRRGQARRGRQRKDFQRDILPGLVSLSRNHVTEDLQTIEELIRANGGTWQSLLSQRNSPQGKGGRGRKRLGVSVAPPAVTVSSPPQTQQPKSGELGLEETRLTGWGKRTRRPPRRRYPINPPPSTHL